MYGCNVEGFKAKFDTLKVLASLLQRAYMRLT